MTGVRVRSSLLRRLIALGLVVAALGACTPTASTSTDTTTTLLAPPRTVLRVGVEEWPTCLNPLLCVDSPLESQILQQVLPGVYRLDASGAYVPTGLLAEPAEVAQRSVGKSSQDAAMTIRYRLNPAARWADGKPITSSDFVGTWRAVMTTPGADTRGYDLISSVDDRDPLEAVVSLTDPYADWRDLFGGAHNHLLKADAFGATTDLTGLFATDLPFAAGPYQLVTWSENEAVLARVDNDWDPDRTAEIDQVRYRPMTVEDVSPDAFDVLVPAPSRTPDLPDGYTAQQAPTTRVVGVWLDQRSPNMQVLGHRRFLALGLDREVLARAAAEVGAVTGTVDCPGWVPGAGPWCEAAQIDLSYRPEQALAALAGEGWAPSPDGPLVRDGSPLTLTVTWDPADPVAASVAGEVTQALAAVGITVAVNAMATPDWSGPRDAATGVGIGIFSLDLGVGPSTPKIYDCPAGPDTSVIGWCPAANADTVAALASTFDPEARADLVATLAGRVEGDSIWIPIVQLADLIYLRSERVTAPALTRVVGGPLAHLAEFTVVG